MRTLIGLAIVVSANLFFAVQSQGQDSEFMVPERLPTVKEREYENAYYRSEEEPFLNDMEYESDAEAIQKTESPTHVAIPSRDSAVFSPIAVQGETDLTKDDGVEVLANPALPKKAGEHPEARRLHATNTIQTSGSQLIPVPTPSANEIEEQVGQVAPTNSAEQYIPNSNTAENPTSTPVSFRKAAKNSQIYEPMTNRPGNRYGQRNEVFDTSNICDEWADICPCKKPNYKCTPCAGRNSDQCGCCQRARTMKAPCSRPCRCGKASCKARRICQQDCIPATETTAEEFVESPRVAQRPGSRFSLFSITVNNYDE